MPVRGPTATRRQLGRTLRRLREAAGRTVVEVESAGLASRSKLRRIERGAVSVQITDVWALCRFYGVDEAESDRLGAFSIGTDDEGWWRDYTAPVPDWFKLFLGLEAAAGRIRTFEDSAVPGELQTTDYARAVYAAAPPADPDAASRHVTLRMDRQQALFSRTPPPRMVVVLGEGVLRRPVGGPAVLDAQLAHLRERDRREHVEIRVLPFAAGAHAAMTGAFRILDFDDGENPDLVYLESQTGASYLEEPAEVAEYRRIFDLVTRQSVPIGEFAPGPAAAAG